MLDNQTIGIIVGGTLASLEVASILTMAVARETVQRKFPRIAEHIGVSVKTTSYRFCAGCDTFVISWFITGNPWASVGIVGLELASKFVLFYSHEFAWRKIKFLARLVGCDDKCSKEVTNA